MSYAVTPLELEVHREVLARLWADNMSDGRIASVLPGRLSWLYEQGPDGPATTVLCLHSESGAVVGCGSLLHRPTWVDGQRVRSGVLCDFAVNREHRVAGAALAIQRGLVEAGHRAGLDLLYGYPNEKSLAVFKRIGYRVVGETTTWVKPLRSGYKLRRALRWRWASAAAAIPIDLGLRLADHARYVRSRGGARGELAPRFDEGFDSLWDRCRFLHGVVGEKSAAYLGWRYGRFTTAEHHTFCTSPADQDRLSGYAVYMVRDGKAYVRDLLAQDLGASVEGLLLALAEHLRRQGLDAVTLSYIGSPAFGDRLRKLGFLRRPGSRSVVVHPEGLRPSLGARVFDPSSWFMLDGELDI